MGTISSLAAWMLLLTWARKVFLHDNIPKLNHIVTDKSAQTDDMEAGDAKTSGAEPSGAEAAGPDPFDSLVASAYENHSNRLLRLPDDILLNIMVQLGPIGIFALVRVCRKFAGLFSDKSLSEYHDGSDQTGKTLWQRFDKTIIKDYRRDVCLWNRCTMCRSSFDTAVMYRDTPPILHCAGCKGDHPVYMFSSSQRQAPAADRICIGREGNIKLCQHKSLQWKDIEQFSQWLASSTDSKFEIRCDQCFRPYRAPRTPLLVVEGSAGRITKLRFFHRTAFCFGSPWRLPAKNMGGILKAGFGPGFGPEGPSWYPEYPPSYLSPMRAFDPNLCSCLVYHGSSDINWRLCESDDPNHVLPCRRSGKILDPISENHLISKYTHSFKSYVGPDSNRSLGITFTRSPDCVVGMEREMEIFLESPNVSLGPWMSQWYLALDPDSYGLVGDDELKGVTWCQDEDCRNYYAVRSGVGRLETSVRDCGQTCFSSIYGASSSIRQAKDHNPGEEI
ncbi:hypothetical protein F5Y04DRAFT_280814 [Hypomontagnella monticulosa]|nr:hypothetical protein F5Y04DRAFT_280814 [Hypomontagnella monticulosa]